MQKYGSVQNQTKINFIASAHEKFDGTYANIVRQLVMHTLITKVANRK